MGGHSVAIVEATTKTPEVPFGDTFVNQCRYILTAVGPTMTRITVTGFVKFLKQTMFKSTTPRVPSWPPCPYASSLIVHPPHSLSVSGHARCGVTVRQAKSSRRRMMA